MNSDELRRQADEAFHQAVKHLMADGWSTHHADEQIADRLYTDWLRDTHDSWIQSGYRDREPLRKALEDHFTACYGEQGGLARMVVFAVLLEARSRRKGHNRAVSIT